MNNIIDWVIQERSNITDLLRNKSTQVPNKNGQVIVVLLQHAENPHVKRCTLARCWEMEKQKKLKLILLCKGPALGYGEMLPHFGRRQGFMWSILCILGFEGSRHFGRTRENEMERKCIQTYQAHGGNRGLRRGLPVEQLVRTQHSNEMRSLGKHKERIWTVTGCRPTSKFSPKRIIAKVTLQLRKGK